MKSTDELLKQIKELNIDEFRKEESFDKIGIGEYLSQRRCEIFSVNLDLL